MSYENEAGDEWGEDVPQQENANLDTKTQIENMFFQAECTFPPHTLLVDMEKKPEDALAAFETVIEMEQQEQECNYQFKALKNMVILYAQKGKEEESRNKLKQLLKICHKVTQNDSRDTLNYILDQLTRILSPASMEGIYEEVMAYLKASNEKLWQSVCMRLCRIYLEKKKYKQLDEVTRNESNAYPSWQNS